jgi:hypothetical protein
MNGIKLFGRFSIMVLIFFSLQGEVILRYVNLSRENSGKHATIPKGVAERQKLIKLQCFTKRILLATVPEPSIASYGELAGFKIKKTYNCVHRCAVPFRSVHYSPLRAPPFAHC